MGRLSHGVIALTLLWALCAWGATGPTKPPDESWLSLQKPHRGKPPVLFSHRRHPQSRIACEQCHHDVKNGRNVWREGLPVEKCQACHHILAHRNVIDAQNAFHRQCKGCHLAQRKRRQWAGPIKCEGCHRL